MCGLYRVDGLNDRYWDDFINYWDIGYELYYFELDMDIYDYVDVVWDLDSFYLDVIFDLLGVDCV